MRLWSVDLKYLDSKGLVALWREALLAKKVLEGKTKGYKNHSQLIRFKACNYPVKSINKYLELIYTEALNRGYNFDKSKIGETGNEILNVTTDQLSYEFLHLMSKLKVRDPNRYKKFKNVIPRQSSFFRLKHGKIESWEKVVLRKFR